MKILLTGATGFVGGYLGQELVKCGHEVVAVSRASEGAQAGLSFTNHVVSWDSLSDAGAVDGIVHLAGDNVAARWTAEKKKRIVTSRVNTTRALVDFIARTPAERRPKVLVSASAVGVYGDGGEQVLREDSPTPVDNSDFLAEVCQAWEREAFLAEKAGVRTVALRFGMVLGRDGGALAKMLPVFRMGLGGRLGSGKQWMSWIHVKDLVGMLRFALEEESVRGVFNAVAPGSVRNADFTRELGRALGRPAVFPVPGFVLKVALGEMSSMLLGGQRTDAGKVMSAGFRFKYPELGAALRDLLNGKN